MKQSIFKKNRGHILGVGVVLFFLSLSSCVTMEKAVIIDKIIVPSEPVGIYGGMTETKYCLSVQGYNKKGKVKVKGVKVTKLVFDSHEVGDTISLVRKMPCSGKSNQDKKH